MGLYILPLIHIENMRFRNYNYAKKCMSAQDNVTNCMDACKNMLEEKLHQFFPGLIENATILSQTSIFVMKIKSDKTRQLSSIMAVCTVISMMEIDKTCIHLQRNIEDILTIFDVNKQEYKRMYARISNKVAPSCKMIQQAMHVHNVHDPNHILTGIYDYLSKHGDQTGILLPILCRQIALIVLPLISLMTRLYSGKRSEMIMLCIIQFVIVTHPGLKELSLKFLGKDIALCKRAYFDKHIDDKIMKPDYTKLDRSFDMYKRMTFEKYGSLLTEIEHNESSELENALDKILDFDNDNMVDLNNIDS